MTYSYMIYGTINAYPIKAKRFKTYDKALRYLDSIILNSDIEIEDIYTTNDTMTTYVANNYSRFVLEKLI